MRPEISDETLMAFADGALDEPWFSQVAEALETDAALAERLHALVQGGDLARSAYGAMLAPVPAALTEAVRGSIAQAKREPVWARFWAGLGGRSGGWAMVGTACAMVLLLPAAYLLGRNSSSITPVSMLSVAGLEAVLDSTPSGQLAALGDGTSVMPIATFTDADGAICREFEASGTSDRIGIACHIEGRWQAQFAVASGGGDAAAYRPASGQAAVETYLQSIGAGEPLLDAAEAEALQAISQPK